VQLAGPIVVAADVTPAAAAHLHLAPGHDVWVAVKATETRAYPADAPTTANRRPDA
jgi:molybdate transport system ATP-binding protein